MAATHALNIDILVNANDLTAYFTSLSVDRSAALVEVNTFGDTYVKRIAGLKDGSISADFIWEAGTGTVDTVLAPLLGTAATLISAAWAGFGTIGNVAELAKVIESTYSVTGDTGSAVNGTVEFSPDGGVHHGWVLRELIARTATSAASNAVEIDTVTTSSSGYVANAHTTAGTGTQDIALYDSADNITFLAIVGATFTQQTGATSQQISSTTQTVRQYVAADLTLASSPNFTTAITFAKR
jgi:hypothetical protein